MEDVGHTAGVGSDGRWAAGRGSAVNSFTTAMTGWPAYGVTALGIIITGFTWAHCSRGRVMKGTPPWPGAHWR